jgi:hypothetical protein
MAAHRCARCRFRPSSPAMVPARNPPWSRLAPSSSQCRSQARSLDVRFTPASSHQCDADGVCCVSVGVVKTPFRTATHAAQVLRGRSGRPLYVTAAGMPIADAARLVAEMAGSFRMPDALKLADRLARGLELPRAGNRPADRDPP